MQNEVRPKSNEARVDATKRANSTTKSVGGSAPERERASACIVKSRQRAWAVATRACLSSSWAEQ
eukprot:2673765-Pleurochrysis_carterae.AAC.2